jgi:hypothetical protein
VASVTHPTRDGSVLFFAGALGIALLASFFTRRRLLAKRR